MTTHESGPILTALLLGVLLAAGAAWVVAGLYRRRMVALMRGGSSPANQPVAPTSLIPPDSARVPVRPDGAANRRATRRTLAALAGLSLLMGITQSWLDLLLVYDVRPVTLNRVLVLGAVYAWPVVMAWGLLRRWSWSRVALAIGVYMLAMGALVMGASTEVQSLTDVTGWLAGVVAIPLLVTLLIGASGRIRAVAPYLLPVCLLLASASVLVLAGLPASPPAWVLWLVGALGAVPTLVLLALLPWVLLAWPVVRLGQWLAQAYRDKHFSDLAYLFAAYWFVVLFASALPAYQGVGAAALVQLLAWMWIPLGAWLLRPWLAPSTPPPTLLVLRVFQQDAKVAQLFDRVVERWRLSGNTVLIAGTDLVSHTLDPDDLFTFLNGDLDSRFIAHADQVEQRLRALDWLPDPDGRYRVNECYCLDTTWQAALAALVKSADVVLMDLRGFQAKNQGCRHELGVLVAADHVQQVVLLVDEHTDRAVVRADTASAPAGRFVWIDAGRLTGRKAGEITAALFGRAQAAGA
jgi:hypothetical protein